MEYLAVSGLCGPDSETVAVQKQAATVAAKRPGRLTASFLSFSAAHLRNKFQTSLIVVQRADMLRFLSRQHFFFLLVCFSHGHNVWLYWQTPPAASMEQKWPQNSLTLFQLGFPVITLFISFSLPPSVGLRPVPQRLPQLGEWRSGRGFGGVAAVHPSPIYLTFGGDAGPPASLPAGAAASALQAHHPEPRPSLRTDWDQEEGLQTGAHETQHQVSQSVDPTRETKSNLNRASWLDLKKFPGKRLELKYRCTSEINPTHPNIPHVAFKESKWHESICAFNSWYGAVLHRISSESQRLWERRGAKKVGLTLTFVCHMLSEAAKSYTLCLHIGSVRLTHRLLTDDSLLTNSRLSQSAPVELELLRKLLTG